VGNLVPMIRLALFFGSSMNGSTLKRNLMSDLCKPHLEVALQTNTLGGVATGFVMKGTSWIAGNYTIPLPQWRLEMISCSLSMLRLPLFKDKFWTVESKSCYREGEKWNRRYNVPKANCSKDILQVGVW